MRQSEVSQPHTYSLPEQFIQDQSVPARWRVWGVINGFFIGGKKCWASNEWIGNQIGSHKDTVSQAVKELEEMHFISCERTARSRIISLGSDPMIGTNAYLRSVPTPISDRHQRLSTSVSNSDSNIAADAEDEIRIEKESPDVERRVPSLGGNKITPAMKAVFAVFDDQPACQTWGLREIERTAAAALFESYPLEELKQRYSVVKKYRGEPMCPLIKSPSTFLDKMPNMENFLQNL